MRDSHALDADYAGVRRKRKSSEAPHEGKKSRRRKRARRLDNLKGKPDKMPTNDHGATILALCTQLKKSEDKELNGLPIELESNTEGGPSQVRGPDEPLAGEGPVQPEVAAGAITEGSGEVNIPAAVPGSRKSWSCVCGIAFTRERDLVRHQRSALIHGGGGYKCRHCDRVLTVMHSLKRHEKACPALKAACTGKAFDPDAKTRGRPAGRRNGASSTGAAGQS